MNLTLAVIKPDVPDPNDLLAYIIRRFEVVALRRGCVPTSIWKHFYAEHRDRPFFGDLVTFMASGPVTLLALQNKLSVDTFAGPIKPSGDVVATWRYVLGATDPKKAEPGTVRCIYGDHRGPIYRNAAHGSDSAEAAARELAFFFSPAELRQELVQPATVDEEGRTVEHCRHCGLPWVCPDCDGRGKG